MLLVLCFYQDIRSRSIHFMVFPLILVVAVLANWKAIRLETVGANLAFLAFLLFILTVYVSLREGKLTDITKEHFAWGDILFLIVILPLFSFRSFIIFFTFGTIAALLMHGITHVISPQKTVPYAGYMAVMSIVYVLLQRPDLETYFIA